MSNLKVVSRSAGVLCIAGGYLDGQNARQERVKASLLAVAKFKKFTFAPADVVDTPAFLLSDDQAMQHELLLTGLRKNADQQGFERVALFGSIITEFMRTVMEEARAAGKSIEFHACPGSMLERCGLGEQIKEAEEAFEYGASIGIMVPG